jgi:hypothetical protein
MTAIHAPVFDLEVYADRHAEMLEEMEAEHRQVLEDASEETAFNDWADDQADRLEFDEDSDRHRDQSKLLDPTPAPDGPGSHIIKLDWPAVRGGAA